MDTYISAHLGSDFFYSMSTMLAWNERNSGAHGRSRVIETDSARRETATGTSELKHKDLRLAFQTWERAPTRHHHKRTWGLER